LVLPRGLAAAGDDGEGESSLHLFEDERFESRKEISIDSIGNDARTSD
jgi:hypothetical protein